MIYLIGCGGISESGRKLLQSILDDPFSCQFTDFEKAVLIEILSEQSVSQVAEKFEVSISDIQATAQTIVRKLDRGSDEKGAGVPRRPHPKGDDSAAEAVPEPTIAIGDLDTPLSLVSRL